MASHIYHGPWINWSHGGAITGATLTVSETNGGLLTSFIATFVTIVGAQLWKILAFAIHQIRTTTQAEDGLFHQQQVIWRNTAAPGAAAWTFAQQVWYWHKRANHSFWRTFTWAVFAALYLVIFAVAAVFSSQISKAPGAQRLIIGDYCGYWELNNNNGYGVTNSSSDALTQRMTNLTLTAATYSRACYSGSYNPLQCSRFPQPSLPWEGNGNATCPFSGDICMYGNTAAYEMTTKVVDSQIDLGINTPKQQRVQFQKKTTCAPLEWEDYYNVTVKKIYTSNTTYFNNTWVEMRYGPNVLNYEPILNYTERANAHGFYDAMGYQLSTAIAYGSNKTIRDGWRPIRQLQRTDADMVLIFLRENSIRFAEPVDDPWFSAHSPIENATWVVSDLYISTLGCAEQYRFCNPKNGMCTPYLGTVQAILNVAADQAQYGFDIMQQSVISRISYASSWTSMHNQIFTRGASALRANEKLAQLDQSALGPLQWQIELASWFDSGLATMQQRILEYAVADSPSTIPAGARLRGPWSSYVDYYTNKTVTPPTNVSLAAQYLCYNQLIRDSSDSMSFSILGMAILFIIGGIIIITSFILDRVVAFFQRLFRFNIHGQRAWMLDDKIQMQKDLFEQSGIPAKWSEDDLDGGIPTTLNREKFSRFAGRNVSGRDGVGGNDVVGGEGGNIYGPNTPDTPWENDGYMMTMMDRKTEYRGAGAGEEGKGMYVSVHEGRAI